MTVESATYISQLNPSLPTGGDPKSEGDQHLRLVKSTAQNTFPNLGAAAVIRTAAELNDVINKAPIASPTLTGTPAAPTAATGDSSTQIATTAFVQTAIANVNSQAALSVAEYAGTTAAPTVGQHAVMSNAAAVTVTLPASPNAGDRVKLTFTNSLYSNVINPNGLKIFSSTDNRTVNAKRAGVEFVYVNATIGWVY